MPEKLVEPCAFCGAEMKLDEHGFDHPQTDNCILSDASFAWANADVWNNRLQSERASMEGEIERLREALRDIEDRVDYAIGMYHDATRWASEDDPDGEGTIRDYVFAKVRAALTSSKTGDE